MDLIINFFRLVFARRVLFVYIVALLTAGAIAFYYFPVFEMVSGLVALSDSNALSGVVSFAQWAVDESTVAYTFIFIAAAPLLPAMAGAILFSGAIGTFASGMDMTRGFPSKGRMGFFYSYYRRFMPLFTLFYISLLLLLLLIFIWVIAAIPLAVIRELGVRGALRPAVYNSAIVVTALFAYICMMYIRIYPLSVITSLYSGSYRPVSDAFSFAGRHFFRVARFFIITDVVMIFLISLYSFFNGSFALLLFNCLIAALLLFFLFYTMFDTFAAKGYGFDESENGDGDDYIYDQSDGRYYDGQNYDEVNLYDRADAADAGNRVNGGEVFDPDEE